MTAVCIGPHVDVTCVDGRGLIVVGPSGHDVFAGPEYAAVMRAVDRARSETEIVSVAAGAVPEADARRAMAELRSADVLVECDEAVDAREAAYWYSVGRQPAQVARQLQDSPVSLAVVGMVDPEPVRSALIRAGMQIGEDADLVVVLTDDYLRRELADANAIALGTGRPWLLASPEATEVWVGPIFTPERGACWECLAQRLRRHRWVEQYLGDAAGRDTPIVRPGGSLPGTRAAAAEVIATFVLRAVALGPAGRHDSLLSIDPRTWKTERHAVLRRPQCQACGVADQLLERPARAPLVASPSRRADGDLRAVPPETTLRRFEHHVSRITGAVSSLSPAPGQGQGYHVYGAGGSAPRRHGSAGDWPPVARVTPGGKGTTDAQARVSALCEALERYCGEFSGEEPRRTGAFVDLPDALHPNDCMGFSSAQFADREKINEGSRSFRTFVPVPFDPLAPIAWTPVWSLTREGERLLPTAFCYYSAPIPGHESCVADSNGNAAGNTVEEAILHGLLELVERDHVALWWYNRLQQPAVDLDSLDDPWLNRVRGSMAREGLRLWALDLTADLGVPVVAALAEPPTGGVTLGFGAHLDLRVATLRAVSELVQLRCGAPSGGAGQGPSEAPASDGRSYLQPAPDVPARRASNTKDDAAAGVGASLAHCRRRVEQQGLEVLVLDQSRPDIGLPVVKVIVPGLRHFWPRFAPGRLFDVPVELGRLSTAHCEGALNPTPLTA